MEGRRGEIRAYAAGQRATDKGRRAAGGRKQEKLFPSAGKMGGRVAQGGR